MNKKGNLCHQKKFPEYVEKDGEKYIILRKFCDETGKTGGFLRHLSRCANRQRRIDKLVVNYDGCDRWYLRASDVERVKNLGSFSGKEVKEEIERDGEGYVLLSRFCAETGMGKRYVMDYLIARGKVDWVFVEYGGQKRRYVCGKEIEKYMGKKVFSQHALPEFIEENGRVYQHIARYAKKTERCVGAVRDRIVRNNLGKMFEFGDLRRWYVLVGLKKGAERKEYLLERAKKFVRKELGVCGEDRVASELEKEVSGEE